MWLNRLKRHPFLLLAALLAVAISYLSWFGIGRHAEIPPGKLEYEAGYSYWVSLERLTPRGFSLKADMPDSPRRSSMQILEDGKALPMAHAEHSEIEKQGSGRYSHWDAGIFFSSSDNTDPRANGRHYTLTYRIYLKRAMAYPALACLAVFAFFSFRSNRQRLTAPIVNLFKHESVQVAAISVFTVVILLAIIEIIFRATSPFNSIAWPSRFDPKVGFYFDPGSEVRHTNYLDFWAQETTNSLGFLDKEPALPSVNDCHVTFIGDSFVEAAQVPIAKKIQTLVEDTEMKRHPEWHLVTSAFGYSGTGQLNQLPFYDRFAKNFAPKLVVLVFVSNDYANNSAILESLRNGWHPDAAPRVFARRDASGQFRLTSIDPQWQDKQLKSLQTSSSSPLLDPLLYLHKGLKKYSYLYHWVWFQLTLRFPSLNAMEGPLQEAQILERVRQLRSDPSQAPLLEGWEDRYVSLDGPFLEESLAPPFAEALEATRFALQEFKHRAESDGARLVVLATSQLTYYSGSKTPYGFLRLQQITKELDIPLVDQYGFIVQQGGNPADAQFKRDGHWTEQAHQWAADAIVQFLEKNPGICEKK